MNLEETKKVRLSQVKVNKENPRTITTANFQKLITSILAFPKMLAIRPIVVDSLMQALGGNMRCQALHSIANMTVEEIASRLCASADYVSKTAGEKQVVIEWWGKWLEKPYAYITDASELSEDERRQFIIKDNANFGQWDYSMLANEWDNKRLDDWGVPVWDTNSKIQQSGTASTPSEKTDSDNNGTDVSTEMKDGNDKARFERLIIKYTEEQLPELLNLLGLTIIEKETYSLNEILSRTKY